MLVRLLLASAVLASMACERAEAQPAPAPKHETFVRTESPAVATSGAPLRAFGRLGFAPGASYAVRAPLSGHVSSVPVAVGQSVEKGTVLAVINSRDAALARSEVAKSAVEVTAAKTTLDRLRALLADKAASDREVREAETRLAQEQAELARAEEAIRALGLEKGAAAFYEVRASAPGRVIRRNIEPGERTGPEDAKEAFLIGDVSRLVVHASAYERDVLGLAPGARAKITVASIPGATFGAKVSNVGDVIDPTSRTCEVRLELDAPDPRLRADTTVTIEIERPAPKALTVPLSGLFLHGDQFVVLAREGSSYVRRPVVVGPAIGDRVPILDGVKQTDVIVVEGALLADAELDRVLDP